MSDIKVNSIITDLSTATPILLDSSVLWILELNLKILKARGEMHPRRRMYVQSI